MKQSTNVTVSILGAGNMGKAIAAGMVSSGFCSPADIILTNKHTDSFGTLPHSCRTTIENYQAVTDAHVIICAVKPQGMKVLLDEIQGHVKPHQLVVSIAAGLPLSFFAPFFDANQPIVRVMPNLCAQVNESMSAWVANTSVSDEQKRIVNQILSSFGEALELETEDHMNAVTAVSGSGPAYIFYLTNIFQQAACNAGLKPEDTQKLILQTLRGSVRLMESSDKSPVQLREAVTSKGGTTEAALEVFLQSDIDDIFKRAVKAAKQRAQALEVGS